MAESFDLAGNAVPVDNGAPMIPVSARESTGSTVGRMEAGLTS